uniref:Uncharacterized protein n=1 Tax=Aegilops tauschii TaxID=37682 RepID=M8BH74_AEGTA
MGAPHVLSVAQPQPPATYDYRACNSSGLAGLVALCLKQIVRTFPHYRRASSAAAGAAVSWTVKINRAALRVGILASAVGSVCGCGFLTMALVNVVQVKLGRLGCGAGGSAAWGAVIPLVTLVPSAMLIYIGIVFYAFTR